jgi:hypothetical protein
MKNLRKIGGFIECLTDYVSQFYADLSAPHPSGKTLGWRIVDQLRREVLREISNLY